MSNPDTTTADINTVQDFIRSASHTIDCDGRAHPCGVCNALEALNRLAEKANRLAAIRREI